MCDVTAPTDEGRLEDLLSEPTPGVVGTICRLDGDILVLGVSGKMGPTLAGMAKRAVTAAGQRRRVIGAARFTSGGEELFWTHGIDTIRCDLLDEAAVARLPDVTNVVFMPARKFGSTGDEATTWAVNSYLPGVVARTFRDSRIVAFSTGNVYPLTPAAGPGPREDDPPQPVGEYAMSCLGRERVFEYFSRTFGTKMAIIRLNYATDLRYGVLVDLARQVLAGEPIDLAMGHFNTIWQGDANAMALRAFDHVASPPWVVNVTGPEVLSVREVCERFGRQLGREVRFTGKEAETALLSDASRGLELFGPLRVTTDRLIDWVADWVSRGGRSLGKPTHFQARDGRF
jgi:nucleoside-diphosphate-sugar epimerase